MDWNETTTREQLELRGIAYSTYENTRGTRVLDQGFSPRECHLRWGQVGDTCSRLHDTIVWAEDDTLIVERALPGRAIIYRLVSRDGFEGDSQIGGSLEQFLTYIRAWVSLDATPGPFASEDGEVA